MAVATVLVCGFGVLGAYVGFSAELGHQMHGVEPGPEATWALVAETVWGFLFGAIESLIVLIALAILGHHLWSRRRA